MPDLRRTNARPTQDHRPCWFGFQHKIRTNRGDGLELVRRWLGEGGGRWHGDTPGGDGDTVGGGMATSHHLRPADINGNGVKADNDAARRVATSSEKWANRV